MVILIVLGVWVDVTVALTSTGGEILAVPLLLFGGHLTLAQVG